MHILDEKPELWPYILASLLIHASLLVLVQFLPAMPKFDEKPIEVFAVTEMPNAKMAREIADIEKPAIERKPTSAKFLGMYDSHVPDEMVGISRRADKMGGEKAGKSGQSKSAAREKPRARTGATKDKLFAFNKELFDEKSRVGDGEEGDSFSPGGLDDFYPDFKRGARTYLNVLRYPDVEYFVRMKRAFKIAFNHEPSLRDHFFRNQVARGSIDVVLGVSVGRSGELSEIFVFRSSGIPTYDEEALRTVRASAPFATPPEKFLADDGFLRMSWTFSVYL